MNCRDIHAGDVVKCSDVNCKFRHDLNQVDNLYSETC